MIYTTTHCLPTTTIPTEYVKAIIRHLTVLIIPIC